MGHWPPFCDYTLLTLEEGLTQANSAYFCFEQLVPDQLNLYYSLGLFSRWQKKMIFFFFFQEYWLWHCMQIEWNLKVCHCLHANWMKLQGLFSGENKKKISKCRSLKFLLSMLSIKENKAMFTQEKFIFQSTRVVKKVLSLLDFFNFIPGIF